MRVPSTRSKLRKIVKSEKLKVKKFLGNLNFRDFSRVLPRMKIVLWCECVGTVVRVGACRSVLVGTLWSVLGDTKKASSANWLIVRSPFQTDVANGLLHLDAHLGRGVAVGRTIGVGNEVAGA